MLCYVHNGGYMAQSISIRSWNTYYRDGYGQQNVQAEIVTGTCYIGSGYNKRPVNISFECSRLVSWMDREIHGIFVNAVSGLARLDFGAPESYCSHEDVAGGCGNKRGYLTECRCTVLDRSTYPAR